MDKNRLYYVHDPMCAWCWGYQPTWQKIHQGISQQWASQLEVIYLVGGLAADTDQPMPIEQQRTIASYWQRIERELGTSFNYDFWSNNTPRRSTYPACRAVIAARKQGAELAMIDAIQQAYYLRALNPSDHAVLLQLASELQLDAQRFSADLDSSELNEQLREEIAQARALGGNSFPSLFLQQQGVITEVAINYRDADATLQKISALLTHD